MDSLAKTRIIETVCGISLRQDMKTSELENSVCQESPQWLTQLSEQITDEQEKSSKIESQRISAELAAKLEKQRTKLEKYKIKSGRLLQLEQSRLAKSLSETKWKTLQAGILGLSGISAVYLASSVNELGAKAIVISAVGCFLIGYLKVDNQIRIG
jgi:hypothetical protein